MDQRKEEVTRRPLYGGHEAPLSSQYLTLTQISLRSPFRHSVDVDTKRRHKRSTSEWHYFCHWYKIHTWNQNREYCGVEILFTLRGNIPDGGRSTKAHEVGLTWLQPQAEDSRCKTCDGRGIWEPSRRYNSSSYLRGAFANDCEISMKVCQVLTHQTPKTMMIMCRKRRLSVHY